MRQNRILACTGAALLALATSAAAWACTKQANLIGLTAQTASPFGEISVKGRLQAGASGVEVRWNGLDGPKLADIGPADSDRDRNFSVPISIPQTAPGIYTVVVAGPDYGVARAAIEVVAGGTEPSQARMSPDLDPSADLWSGMSEASSNAVLSPVAAGESASGPIGTGMVLFGAGIAGAVTAAGVALSKRGRAVRSQI